MSEADRTALEQAVARLCDRCDRLEKRVAALESENETLRAETERLQNSRDRVRETNAALRDRVETLTDRVTELEATQEQLQTELEDTQTDLEATRTALETTETDLDRVESKTDAAINRSGLNRDRIAELQSRELEKGAHLATDHVDRHAIAVEGGRLEKLTRDDGSHYYRVPDASDPLDRDGSVALSHADLLPIQQLARMDRDMRRSAAGTLPARLAAALWQARVDPDVGDNPWQPGGKGIREYITAGDLKHWIRRQESGISETYAKKLVSRTIDAILDLSKNRLAVRKQTERKNGLAYTERRLILPADVDLPGDRHTSATTRETPDVHG